MIDKRTHQVSKDIFNLANLLVSNRTAQPSAKQAAAQPAAKPQEKGGLFSRLLPKR